MAIDIKNDATLSTNLISCWLSDSSGLVNDLHGSNNLTNNNGVTSTTLVQGNAGDFEVDSTQFLSITDTASLSITSDLSFSVWLRLESLAANQVILNKWNATGDQRSYSFFINSSGIVRAYISDDGTNANTSKLDVGTTALSATTTYHIVVTYDASAGQCQLWVNGASDAATTGHKASIKDSTADFTIGGAAGDFNWADGIMNQVCIWNKVLSNTEISDLYNSGTGIPYNASSGTVANIPTLLTLGIG